MITDNIPKLLFPFCVFVFVSTGVYVFDAGYPQPGHFFLLAFAIPLILKPRSLVLELPEKFLLAFVGYTLVVNGCFYLSIGGIDFFIASVY